MSALIGFSAEPPNRPECRSRARPAHAQLGIDQAAQPGGDRRASRCSTYWCRKSPPRRPAIRPACACRKGSRFGLPTSSSPSSTTVIRAGRPAGHLVPGAERFEPHAHLALVVDRPAGHDAFAARSLDDRRRRKAGCATNPPARPAARRSDRNRADAAQRRRGRHSGPARPGWPAVSTRLVTANPVASSARLAQTAASPAIRRMRRLRTHAWDGRGTGANRSSAGCACRRDPVQHPVRWSFALSVSMRDEYGRSRAEASETHAAARAVAACCIRKSTSRFVP